MFFKNESDKFREELTTNSPKGKSDATAIVLPEITVDEFVCLLDFIYYRCVLSIILNAKHPELNSPSNLQDA